MKVTKSTEVVKPKYPSTLQFQRSRAVMGAAAIGLGALAVGCYERAAGMLPLDPRPTKTPAESVPTTLGGEMTVEPKARTQDYVIKKGDTLSLIAHKTLGDKNRWKDISALNTGLTADTLKAGQTIKVPVVP